MEKAVAELLAEMSDGEVREGYSGRGMFGRVTCGVVLDSMSNLVVALLENAEEVAERVESMEEEGIYLPDSLRTDSMGMGMGIIIY